MLQRIQTVFLLVAAVLGLIYFFIPFATFTEGSESYVLNFLGLSITTNGKNFQPVNSMVVTAFSALTLILPIVSIFLYKNRSNQVKLANINLAISGGLFAMVLFYVLGIGNFIETQNEITTAYGVSMVIPLIQLVLTYLAINNIKKDEKLIKSLDRLR